MPSILGDFLSGYGMQKKAMAKQADDDRKFAFDLAAQNQTRLNSAEEEVTKLNEFMASDSYDPGQAAEAFRRAAAIDRNYSDVLGESMVVRTAKALHMTSGPKGPPAQEDITADGKPPKKNPLYGWMTSQQKTGYEDRERGRLTEREAANIRMRAGDEISKKSRLPDGSVDWAMLPAHMANFETQLLAEGFDRVKVDQILDDLEDAYGSAQEQMAAQMGKADEYSADLEARSVKVSSWIKSVTGLDPTIFEALAGGGIAGESPGAAALMMKMEQAGQRMVRAGYDLHTIKWRLNEMWKTSDATGGFKLPTGTGGGKPWEESYLGAPQEAIAAWEQFIKSTPDAELSTKPVWSEEAGHMAIRNLDFNPAMPPSDMNWEFLPLLSVPIVQQPKLGGQLDPSPPMKESVKDMDVPGEFRFVNVPGKVGEFLKRAMPKVERSGGK